MENNWDISKLLVTEMNPKMFFYEIGKYPIYVQNVRPIPPLLKQTRTIPYHFGSSREPHLVVVRSPSREDVLPFIQEHPEFQVSKIFKSGLYFNNLSKERVRGFAMTSTCNMLHLLPGSSFRIRSNNTDLRDLFYEAATTVNDTGNLGCSFDFLEYDYTLLIKAYRRVKGYAVIAILYGWDMPNHWGMFQITGKEG